MGNFICGVRVHEDMTPVGPKALVLFSLMLLFIVGFVSGLVL
jgi:hypothetical protein